MQDNSIQKVTSLFAKEVREGLTSFPKFLSSKYFYDENLDKLTFTISNVSEVDVDVNGEIATFTPNEGVLATKDIVISATDGKNTTFKSISLIVNTGNGTSEKQIDIKLEYDSYDAYDPNNDGVENLNGVIDDGVYLNNITFQIKIRIFKGDCDRLAKSISR